jgi:hypothetical protein
MRATKLRVNAQVQPELTNLRLQTMYERGSPWGTATSDQPELRQLDLEYQGWARLPVQARGRGPHTAGGRHGRHRHVGWQEQ